VLVAVDGSACSLLALGQAKAEGRRRKAPVEVVHVATRPDAESPLDDIPELRNATTKVLVGPVGATLVRASGQARMIILGPRGTRGSGLLGSVAREVLHRGACPTVFVHGGAIPAQRAEPKELTTAY
jgi:nucleotide-binding universal stress UspA family protein